MRSKSLKTVRRKERLILNIKTLNIAVFVVTISFFALSSIIIPKGTVSEVEKRELASMPAFSVESLLSGSYFKDLESFYNDTFPFREKFLQVASNLEDTRGIREGEDEIKIYNTVNK